MSGEEESDDKQFDASQRKLDQAREKGQIARSPDLVAAAGLAGFVLIALVWGKASLLQIGQASSILIGQADALSTLFFAGGTAPMAGVMIQYLSAFVPFVLGPAMGVLLMLVVSRGMTFTPENLMPKLSRISPLASVRNKFGVNGLVEFAKNLIKLIVVSTLLGTFLWRNIDQIIASLYQEPGQSTLALLSILIKFLCLVVIVAGLIGGADFLWQRHSHMQQNRMSRKEMMDEHKESEGDPHTKAKRRQRGQEIAMNQMLADVGSADVIVVNPTHYAVALKWDRASRRAPVCLAKGVDEIAARIRERAAEAGIPIHRDPPTARAIHATVELGKEIRPEHYRAVAAAIRFAEAMRKKVRHRP